MIIALHGFLGLPSDWLTYDNAFQEASGRPHSVRKWSLYADLPSQPPAPDEYPLRIWAKSFCERIERGWQSFGSDERTKPVLLGYSMGGRLALHALLEKPDLFSAVIVVGAHPGLSSEDLRKHRVMNDAKWAERFRTEEWDGLIGAWGEQEVFGGRSVRPEAIELNRQEVDYNRVDLARAMQLWSLGRQEDLRPELASVTLPTLWVNGSFDRRFQELYTELQMDLVDTPAHQFAEVEQAGHRVPWDNPTGFYNVIQKFLNKIG